MTWLLSSEVGGDMTHGFAEIAFTPNVREMQREMGSRGAYSRMEEMPGEVNATLSEAEAAFISARDSFYIATVNEDGWPYIQHRGGPTGFVRILDAKTLGVADFRGNRQYITVGNLSGQDKVSLFFMDYSSRTRLKLFGRAQTVAIDRHDVLSRLGMKDYPGRVERGLLIRVEGFDWNCPQHITERYTMEDIRAMTAPLVSKIAMLEGQLRSHSIPVPTDWG